MMSISTRSSSGSSRIASSASLPFSAKRTAIPWPSSTLVRAKTLRTSSSTTSTRLPWNTASALCSCSSMRRFSCGSRDSTRWRNSDVSSSSRSGELTSFTMIVSA